VSLVRGCEWVGWCCLGVWCYLNEDYYLECSGGCEALKKEGR